MTYAEAIQYLYSLRLFGTKLGLENTFRLAAAAGNPQARLRFIHVAGTNGKGSTCAMLESIYRAAGLRVGLFTSPHLVAFGERMQVNRRPISEGDVVRLVGELQAIIAGGLPDAKRTASPLTPALSPLRGEGERRRRFKDSMRDSGPGNLAVLSDKELSAEAHPTFFEVITIMALRYFAEQSCDLVIWETGLGGRLDATNIVTPLASVITSIALDHEKWLGDTIDKIAGEKAGIIKPGVPVITSATAGHGLERITEVARLRHSPLILASDRGSLPDAIRLPLLGEFQRVNAAVALATVHALGKTIPVTEKVIAEGMSRVTWPGRMQLIEGGEGRFILLDGAHNPAGAEALCAELHRQFPAVKPTIILGVLGDKDWNSIGRILAPMGGRVVLTPVKSERTLAPEELLRVCQESNPQAQVSVAPSLAAALKETDADRAVVITGSLYLVGEALELLGLSPAPSTEERGLNEWGAAVVR